MASYDLSKGKHALCNAHLLRELNGLLDEHPKWRWPKELKTLIVDIKKAVESAVANMLTCLAPETSKPFEERYDKLVSAGLRRHPRPRHDPRKRGRPKASPQRNLLERLRDHKTSILRFAHDFSVPFDNNLSERDLRMAKVKQKISGCFRSLAGAENFACIRSYISTARKQGYTALDAIRAVCDGAPVPLQLA